MIMMKADEANMPFQATTQPQPPSSPSASTDGSLPLRRKSAGSQSAGRNRLRKKQAGATGAESAIGIGGAKATKKEGGATAQAPAGPTLAPTRPATSAPAAAKSSTRSRAWTYLSGGENTMRCGSGLAPSSTFATEGKADVSSNGTIDHFAGTATMATARARAMAVAMAPETSLQANNGGIGGVALPKIIVQDEAWGDGRLQQEGSSYVPDVVESMDGGSGCEDEDSQRITTTIPTGSLDDLYDDSKLQFSKRGSLLVNDQKVRVPLSAVSQQQQRKRQHAHDSGQRKQTKNEQGEVSEDISNTEHARRVLSEEEIKLSRKIRAMYEYGDETAGKLAVELVELDGDASSEAAVTEDGQDTHPSRPGSPLEKLKSRKMISLEAFSGPTSGITSRRCSMITKAPSELAGGIEDWAEVSAKNVDRYGFIVTPRSNFHNASGNNHSSMDMPRPHRVSTALQIASETQRQKPSIRLALSSSGKRKKTESQSRDRRLSNATSHTSRKAPASIRSFQSDSTAFTSGFAHSHLWQATNHLLHSRRKRVLDEAGDMLALPVGYRGSLSAGGGNDNDENSVGNEQIRTRTEQEARMKEWRREEKWRKMAHLVPRGGGKGGGMEFRFDTRDPKLVNRAWKGIPDRWRASAWYCFLAESAKKRSDCESHAELVERFNELQDENGADDSQIDVDVPRTISSHIMFRRRYRGGQRLLFRVLHAVSLYFPETGYVQGMASLAASLLCYYDEENTFIMLVRMWQLRGLKHLYESGFGGLMEALEQFERDWLRDGEVAKKLGELGISSTAYGTRWYLTLFNYSIPFAAQLRVWDVFMLLGDPSLNPGNPGNSNILNTNDPNKNVNGFISNNTDIHNNISGNSINTDIATNRPNTSRSVSTSAPLSKSVFVDCDLDVLHATSAALIDASRDILINASFENAMKVLTSWVPIQDEDLFMRVVKAEWKERKRRVGKAAH